jgi:2-alkyl-3-oxoalkanoate reductase
MVLKRGNRKKLLGFFGKEAEMKIKVAIVGATGVLGRNLVSLFQREGRAVRALVRYTENIKGLLGDDSEALPCDLLKIPGSLLTEYLKGCDVVIHAASAVPARPRETRNSEWELNNQLRMEGTSKLIDAARRAGVGLYLQQSVVSAYINGDDRWLDENTPFDILPGRVMETLAVADMERRVREIKPEVMRWAILRGGTFVGPGTNQDQLIGKIRRTEEAVEGEGNYFFSPVHVEDMARAFVKAAAVKIRAGVFNVVDEPLRYGDYVDYLADRERAARPKRIRSVTKFASQRCSNEAARKQLGWFPRRSFYSPETLAVGA